MEKRTLINRFLLWCYMFFYIVGPVLVLGWGFNMIPQKNDYSWISWSAGVGLLFFSVTALIFVVRHFPQSTKKGLWLFIPLIINSLYFMTAGCSIPLLMREYFVESSSLYGGLILAVVLTALFQPWYGDSPGGKGTNLLKGISDKIAYVRKNPAVLAGLAVLMIPFLSAVYFFLLGMEINGEVMEKRFPGAVNAVIYIVTVGNITAFHYRELALQFYPSSEGSPVT